MARRQQSRGVCTYCEKEMTKGGLTRHLKTCASRQQTIAQSTVKKSQNIYHLQVQDAYGGDFWLHLEMNGTAPLDDLDGYLRAIWLECCGHMSEFSFGGAYSGNTVGMSQKVDRVFDVGDQLTHVYDFGDTSETTIKCVDVRQGVPLTRAPIALMARNNIPTPPCKECEKIATHLCFECVHEYGENGLLCDEHTESHPHENYDRPMALVNSPRLGYCAYTGPADPPY